MKLTFWNSDRHWTDIDWSHTRNAIGKKANFQRCNISNEIRTDLASPSLCEHEKFPSHDHAVPNSHGGSLSLFFSCIVNKFKAVVWDRVQVQNNETSAFDSHIHGLFLERGPLRNTGGNPCSAEVRRTSAHHHNALASKAPGAHGRLAAQCQPGQALGNAVPSTGKGRFQHEKQTSPCLFGEWLSHWARRKIIFSGWGKC